MRGSRPTRDLISRFNHSLGSRAYEAPYDSEETHVFRPWGGEVRSGFEARAAEPVREAFAPQVPGRLWRRIPAHRPYVGVFRRR